MAPTVLPGIAQQMEQEQKPGLLNSLGNMFSGGGMGNMTPQQQMMLSLGAGMLANSRRRPGEAFGAAVPQAMQTQMMAQKLFSEDEEKKRKERAQQALGTWLNQEGIAKTMGPGWSDLVSGAPELAMQVYRDANKNPEESTGAIKNWRYYQSLVAAGDVEGARDFAEKFLNKGTNVYVGPQGDERPEGVLGYTDKGAYMRDPSSPTGRRFVPDPGTKGAADVQSAELEAADAERVAGAKNFNEAFRSGVAGQKVQRIREILKDPANRAAVSGYRGRVGQSINPTGVAGEYARTLDTLKAGQGFRELQTMRAENKTGGALGQVTERELAFLQQTLGTLDPTASPEEIERTMDNIEAQYQAILSKLDYNDPEIGKVLGLLGIQEGGAAPAAPIQTEDGFTIEVQ